MPERRPEWLRVIDGSPRKCGPDEYEVEPTILGLVRWQREQAQRTVAESRHGLHVVSEEE
jgi:hypothetical protein